MQVKARGRSFWNPDDDIDGWIDWVLLDTKEVEHLGDVDIVCNLGMVHEYSGPGLFFSYAGSVRRGRNRVLVTQYCGYDI